MIIFSIKSFVPLDEVVSWTFVINFPVRKSDKAQYVSLALDNT